MMIGKHVSGKPSHALVSNPQVGRRATSNHGHVPRTPENGSVRPHRATRPYRFSPPTRVGNVGASLSNGRLGHGIAGFPN